MKLRTILENLQKEKTSQDLRKFLEKFVPFLVRKNIVGSRALKVCGNVSTEFVYFAKKHGFKAVTASSPGHFYNVVGTSDGTWKVDLSYIQFVCKLPEMPFDSYEEEKEEWDFYNNAFEILMKDIHEDPFSATEIKKIGEREEFKRYEGMYGSEDQGLLDYITDYYEQSYSSYQKKPERYIERLNNE